VFLLIRAVELEQILIGFGKMIRITNQFQRDGSAELLAVLLDDFHPRSLGGLLGWKRLRRGSGLRWRGHGIPRCFSAGVRRMHTNVIEVPITVRYSEEKIQIWKDVAGKIVWEI